MSTSVAAPRASAAVEVGRALTRISRDLEHCCAGTGLSLAQYRVLLFVAQRPQRAAALAAHADVRRATLSAIVHGLVAAGLVERHPVAEDGRGVSLALTTAGRAQLAETEGRLGAHLHELLAQAGLDPEVLAGQLGALLEALEPADDHACPLAATPEPARLTSQPARLTPHLIREPGTTQEES